MNGRMIVLVFVAGILAYVYALLDDKYNTDDGLSEHTGLEMAWIQLMFLFLFIGLIIAVYYRDPIIEIGDIGHKIGN